MAFANQTAKATINRLEPLSNALTLPTASSQLRVALSSRAAPDVWMPVGQGYIANILSEIDLLVDCVAW